jgi:hypothetical protein
LIAISSALELSTRIGDILWPSGPHCMITICFVWRL